MNTSKTLIILNPHAGSGRAGKLWSKIEPLLWKELGDLVVAVTEHPAEVAQHLEKARDAGLTRVIAIGGDGTNHALINELIRLNRRYPGEPQMTFGSLPIGTGQDWARSMGVPSSPANAVEWIKNAHPVAIDAGHLQSAEGLDENFLNIASVGIGGMIAQRINRLKQRRPWSFYRKTVETLLAYRPYRMSIKLDGKTWYEGTTYLVAVANGQIFGHGMRIAPDAQYNDGLFDVVLIEGMPRLEAVMALNTVYTGEHLKRDDVHLGRGHVVEIEGDGRPLSMELDGESAEGRSLRFEILPRALSTLAS